MPRVRKYYKQEAEQHIEALLGIYINCQITGICFRGNVFQWDDSWRIRTICPSLFVMPQLRATYITY
jgi:hypothetical protein